MWNVSVMGVWGPEQKCWQDHHLGHAEEDGEGISHRLLAGWM